VTYLKPVPRGRLQWDTHEASVDVKLTEASPAVGPGTGRVCVTGTGCVNAPASKAPLSYVASASQLAGRLFPVSSMRGRMPPCLRSHATIPTLPRAASQPNLYIDSAPSGAFQIQSIYYDSCTHTKFYSYEPGQRFNYFIVITLPRIQIATASTVAIDSNHVAQFPQRFSSLIALQTSHILGFSGFSNTRLNFG
jgi:hypothetical protein